MKTVAINIKNDGVINPTVGTLIGTCWGAAGVREGISTTAVETEGRGVIATSKCVEAKLSAWVAFVIAVVFMAVMVCVRLQLDKQGGWLMRDEGGSEAWEVQDQTM